MELERKLLRPLEAAYPPTRRLDRGNLAEQAEDAAAELRGRLGLGQSPIPDLLGLIESELRIRLFIVPLPSRVSGAYAYMDAHLPFCFCSRKRAELAAGYVDG